MKVSIRDLAAKCGLSVSAVSKALNNYPDISKETRALVLRTAQEIGYFPNASARTLKTNRSRNIGVLFEANSPSGMTHPFFSALLESFKAEAEKSGYDLTFLSNNAKSGMTYLEHCRYRNVDGAIIVCADFSSKDVQVLLSSDIPTVAIDYPAQTASCVLSENENGMYALTKYAVSMGHKKIAYLHGEECYVHQNRLNGYKKALEDAGIGVREDYILPSSYDNPAEAAKAFKTILALPDRPTCILMADDTSAITAIQTAKSMNLSVPGDISIGGYDGVRLSLMFSPVLSTIKQDTFTMGKTAAEELIRLIENPSGPKKIITVPNTLVSGESIGRIE